jgi:hypothetical protein
MKKCIKKKKKKKDLELASKKFGTKITSLPKVGVKDFVQQSKNVL